MRRSRYQNRTQLVLQLARLKPELAVARETKGVVETLADLLLEALGGAGTPRTGGMDEHQDHA